MSAPEMIVLTGGPGAGKTTLIDALAARGERTVAEAAIQEIAALIEELGVEGCRDWRRANTYAFQLRVARRQLALEAEARAAGPGLVFCDRGLPDGLGYLAHRGEPVTDELRELIAASSYRRVFLLATLSDFALRSETGRTSNREASLALGRAVADAYRGLGYEVIELPELPPEQRLARLLEAVADLR